MTEIMAIGPWNDNGEMMVDVLRLGYLREPILDLTYGEGGFWSGLNPEFMRNVTTNDSNRRKQAVYHDDFRATQWECRSYRTVILDPPYAMRGTPSNAEMDNRYGTEEPMPREKILSLLVGGIAEACRLSDELVLVKTMDMVSSGEVRWQTDAAADVARAMEFRKIDSLLLPGYRQQPNPKQVHTRRNYSTLLVFSR